MNQIIHIFRKDTRRHWPEILISIGLLIAYAWRQPRSWILQFDVDPMSQLLTGLVSTLLPVAWIFLIARVVYSEPLVGDRQFWITRPYEWRSLLAAKILFVGTFLNIPLFLIDVLLLRIAGFSSASHMVGLLWMQVLMAMILFLPIMTLASITSNISKFLLTMLGLVLSLIIAITLLPKTSTPNVSAPNSILSAIPGAVILVAMLMAVVCQYSRR